MAITIKPIPVLKGKAAITFNQKASKNSAKKFTVDFSKQKAEASKILAKAKI